MRKLLITTLLILSAGSLRAEEAVSPEHGSNPSAVSFTADLALQFFQVFISPVDNRRCIFSPTCSAYARKAIAKYGFIKAYPLITARLIRCNPGAWSSHVYEAAEPGKGGPCYDPVP